MRISDWSSDVCSSDLKRSNGAAAPVPPARRDAISALRTRPQEASSCDDPAFGEFAKRCRLIQWRRERLEEPLELGAPEIDVCNERRMLGSICHQLEGDAGHGLVSTTALRQAERPRAGYRARSPRHWAGGRP